MLGQWTRSEGVGVDCAWLSRRVDMHEDTVEKGEDSGLSLTSWFTVVGND
jgi:hypothetical protein